MRYRIESWVTGLYPRHPGMATQVSIEAATPEEAVSIMYGIAGRDITLYVETPPGEETLVFHRESWDRDALLDVLVREWEGLYGGRHG